MLNRSCLTFKVCRVGISKSMELVKVFSCDGYCGCREKDGDADRILKNGLIKDNDDVTDSPEIWLTSGDSTLYLSPSLIDKENRIKSAMTDTMSTIKVTVNKVFDLTKIKEGIKLSRGTIVDVTTTKDAPTVLTITTKEAIDLKTPLTITLPGYGDATASIGAIVRTDAFDQTFAYTNPTLK